MKADEILDAIGAVDEKCVERAKEKQKSNRRGLWITMGAAAACLALVIMILGIQNFTGYFSRTTAKNKNTAPPANGSEIAIAQKDVWIYYVDGEEIRKKSEYLPCVAKDVFNAWKEKNRIGDDVEIIEVQIDSNGTTERSEFNGDEIARYEVGDTFIFNITISAEIENYYDDINAELLLASLKQTMTGYLDMEFDEYNLILW